MKSVPIDQFITGLCAISDEEFRVRTVYDYLEKQPVDEHSLRPYLFFSAKQYTRNLIFKNELFELVAVCWEVGQASKIHNHSGQKCWMTIPQGRLRVQNFRVLEQDSLSGYCRIEHSDTFDLNQLLPVAVDPTEPVHQVLNLAEVNQRAISLHIYSRPFDRCLIY